MLFGSVDSKGLRFLISPPESTLLGNSEVLILKGLRCCIGSPESTRLGTLRGCNKPSELAAGDIVGEGWPAA
jgi:hypothetical protein